MEPIDQIPLPHDVDLTNHCGTQYHSFGAETLSIINQSMYACMCLSLNFKGALTIRLHPQPLVTRSIHHPIGSQKILLLSMNRLRARFCFL